ncbi:MAG: hypothetical protein LBR80_01630 [Deltaproteobacteria bacterium]|jgi:uncharacterized membrane protein|nr:hypothetical protein [Deltaproteobacteria bacterium]
MRKTDYRPNRASAALCAAAAALLLFSGCAGQKLGAQTVKVNYYPECYQPVTDMRQNAEKLNESVMKGAIAGAITGGIAGLLSGGSWRSVAAGAAIGAVAGATIAYLTTAETQAKAQEERFALYNQTLDVDYGNIDQAVAAARITAACYKREYQRVATEFKARRMSQEEMVARVTEIRDGSRDAAEILRNYHDVAGANIETYDNLVRAEAARSDDRPPPARVNQVRTKVSRIRTTQTAAGKLIDDLELTASASDTILQSVRTAMGGFLVADLPWKDLGASECLPCNRSFT